MNRLRRHLMAFGPLLLGFALAAGLLVVSEYSNWRATHALKQMELSLEIRLALTALRRQVLEAETGQRGYLITGKDDYAKPYYEARLAVDRTLEQLRQHYHANPKATFDFDALALLVKRKMEEMALTIQLRAMGNEVEWRKITETDIGRDLMVTIDSSTARLLDAEQRQLVIYQNLIGEALLLGRIGIALVTMLAMLAFVSYLRQTSRLNKERRRQEEALERERDHLEIVVSQRTRQLSQLASHLVTAREDERARLARELHDELGALFTTAKLDVARLKSRLRDMTPEASERFTHLTETLNTGVALKRRIIEDLRPSSLSNLGLVAALDILVREFSSRLEAKLEASFEPVQLSPACELTVYRLVQEALTNIGKYAGAKNVIVDMRAHDDMVKVQIRDDGKGFDTSATPPMTHGLFGMRFRIEEAGGRFTVNSRPGAGTLIGATLPVLKAQHPPT